MERKLNKLYRIQKFSRSNFDDVWQACCGQAPVISAESIRFCDFLITTGTVCKFEVTSLRWAKHI